MPDDPVPPRVPPSEPDRASLGEEAERRTTPHERHPHPCQRAYTNLRGRVLAALTRPRRLRVVNLAQYAVRAVLLVLDVPVHWFADIIDTFISNRGYVAIGTILAAYFAVFGLIDAKSTQEETRASLERSLFITLVSSGNAASFVAAMKDFGPIQTMPATVHPSWFDFWHWGQTYSPNEAPMWDWAVWRLRLCSVRDCSSDSKFRIDLSGADLNGAKLGDGMTWGGDTGPATIVDLSGADLSDAELYGADLSGAKLNGAKLTDADSANLTRADLSGADLTGAILSDTNLHDADLSSADLSGASLHFATLSGADLTGAALSDANLNGVDLRGARYLTQAQLDQACGTNAKLPPGLTLRPCPP